MLQKDRYDKLIEKSKERERKAQASGDNKVAAEEKRHQFHLERSKAGFGDILI